MLNLLFQIRTFLTYPYLNQTYFSIQVTFMNPQEIQLQYYKNTAPEYENAHFQEQDEHIVAFNIICSICSDLGAESILDIGCGTGRNVKLFTARFPQANVMGSDISPDMLKIAAENYNIPESNLVCCSSYELPFPDNSFDFVTEFAVLHHVEEPDKVVAEMLRVARKAIFISDSNRFGQGSLLSRLFKLFLCKVGLWWPSRKILNGGKRWNYSEGDGVYYSYSVFDSISTVEASCSKVFALVS